MAQISFGYSAGVTGRKVYLEIQRISNICDGKKEPQSPKSWKWSSWQLGRPLSCCA
jgi:hypothetical protein